MENRSHSPGPPAPRHLTAYVDPLIREDLEKAQLSIPLPTADLTEAKLLLQRRQDRLWVTYPDGEHCDFPYYLKNVTAVFQQFQGPRGNDDQAQDYAGVQRLAEAVEKRIFSSAPVTSGKKSKDLWDEIIKKVNQLSTESHGLRDLVRRLLDVPFLQGFQSALIVLHLKGQNKAEMLGTLWRSEKHQSLVEVKDFNAFFTSVRKSKIKSFSSENFSKLNLPFNGSFLAKEVVSMKYSLVVLCSRHDFLSYSAEEIDLFETCIDLLQPHLERLVDQEFSDQRVSELRVCLKDFPLPLRVRNTDTGTSFENDLIRPELQGGDVFFSQQVHGPFSLELFDSDELRHYAFDLFHFQRISLLGELLNTLRHELSNPLFGLKLSSQIFTTLEVGADNKELMQEIEKNINRCQLIMENFSRLYQVQEDPAPVALKKIIDEALVLSKSEARGLRKRIDYGPGTEDLMLPVPLIFVVQIIFNLIVNSAQAVRQGGTEGELHIRIQALDGMVAVDVQDSGPGIPEDKLPQLFKPFFTTKAQGTGLGLLLSRNLALKMGGNLEHFPDNRLKGACFRLTLPTL